MWTLKRIWYRVFQAVFAVCEHLLPWRRPDVFEGEGSVAKLPELLHGAGAKLPLIVTDPGLMKAGVARAVLDELDECGIAYSLFCEVEANPSIATVEKARAQYISEGCDSLAAIGGGSAMDAAKAVGARIVRPRKSLGQLGGLLRVLKRLPPIIAIPTTAGTGSETTIAAVITDRETHHKYALYDLSLVPHYAILDPELTEGLPPAITAATGMDALTHAVEAYLSVHGRTKETVAFSEHAVKLIFGSLEKAYVNGSDMEARANMLRASFEAGVAFTRAGVGNVHTIAHTLGGMYNTPHGLANAVIMPYVLEDYGSAVYKKLARLYDCAGLSGETSEEGRARAFIAEIRAMNARMGIPSTFDFIRDEDIPTMVRFALKECNPLYAVPVIYDEVRCAAVIERFRAK